MEKKNFNKKILIISSNFYADISKNLQEGVLNVLKNENSRVICWGENVVMKAATKV